MRMSASGSSALAMRPEMPSSSTPMNRMPSGARLMKRPTPQPGSSTVEVRGMPRRVSASCMAVMTSGEV